MSRFGSPEQHRPTALNWVRQLSLMLTGGAVLAGSLFAFGLWRTGDRFLQGVYALFNTPQPQPAVDVQSILLHQVRGASDLTTAVFAMEAVVPTSRDRTLGTYVIGKTTLLYIAYGEVRAGIDLSQLQPEDIQIAGDAVSLRLPPPRILDSKIDVTRSSVYDYDRGFLGLGPDVAPQLQQLAQQETLDRIRQTACSEGLLEEANARAELVVSQLLSTAGYQNFEVETQSAAPSACLDSTQTPATTAAPPLSSSPAPNPLVSPSPSLLPAPQP